jgi:hypothetical protein
MNKILLHSIGILNFYKYRPSCINKVPTLKKTQRVSVKYFHVRIIYSSHRHILKVKQKEKVERRYLCSEDITLNASFAVMHTTLPRFSTGDTASSLLS